MNVKKYEVKIKKKTFYSSCRKRQNSIYLFNTCLVLTKKKCFYKVRVQKKIV